MDPNLDLYRSTLHLPTSERRERLQHLSLSERGRVRLIVERENHAQLQQERIAGRDLVQEVLADPSEILACAPLKYALLGRNTFTYDEDMMVKRITNNSAKTGQSLIDRIAGFDRLACPFPLDAWKLVYCDLYYVDDGSTTLQEIYEARLREDEAQAPAARAREIVRSTYTALLKARRNAKWMIPAFENLSDYERTEPDLRQEESKAKLLEATSDKALRERIFKMFDEDSKERRLEKVEDNELFERNRKQAEYKSTLERMWKHVSPVPPAWIRHILDTQEQWGFAYYLSREVDQQYGCNWESTWSRINNTSSPTRVTYHSIHTQGMDNWITIKRLNTESWPLFQPDKNMSEDDNLRKHFNEYIQKNRSEILEHEKKRIGMYNVEEPDGALAPGLLRSTFIVIPIELVASNLELEEDDLLSPHWVWAYDADWDNSEEETVFNGEKYEGRVKVSIWSVKSWFYAARWEGVSLRDMWLKAQQHPDKMWICYTKELEEWDHESYV